MDKRIIHVALIALALLVFTKLSFDAIILGTAAIFIHQVKSIKL